MMLVTITHVIFNGVIMMAKGDEIWYCELSMLDGIQF